MMQTLFRTKNIDKLLSAGQSSHLKKVLGPIDLILLGIGVIVGAGIFVITGVGVSHAGPGFILSFIIASIVCCFAAMCYAEFSSMLPVTGSVYTYAYATLGELIAWMIGWDLILEYGLAAAAVSVGWSAYFQSLLSSINLSLPTLLMAAPSTNAEVTTLMNLPAFIILILVTYLLSIGTQASSRINNVMVFVKIAVIGIFLAVGAFHIKPQNWMPFMPFGWSGVFSGASIAFFAFIGFDMISSTSEEVKNPKRDLPIGIIGALLVCGLLYAAVAIVVTGILPYQQIIGVDNPVSFALQYVQQNWVAGFINMGAIMGLTTGILVTTYGQSRLIFAMSRDGLLPKPLSKVHPRYSTPYRATWFVGIIFALLAAFIPMRILTELISIGTLAAFCVISVAVIVLRKTRPDLPRPFRCPASPWLPLFSLISCLYLMQHLNSHTWIAFFIWMIIGLAIYFLYGKRHSLLNQ